MSLRLPRAITRTLPARPIARPHLNPPFIRPHLFSSSSFPPRMSPKKHARSVSSDDGLRHPSTKVAKKVDADPPFAQLTDLLASTASDSAPRNVLHWFRSKDLRVQDNKALAAASRKARHGSGHLIALYLHSPADLEWHGTSPARVDFILESLRLVREELAAKNIPLAVVTADARGEKSARVLEFVQSHRVSHVYGNFEYEIDELRRDLDVGRKAREAGVGFELSHDQTVVVPAALRTGSGGPHKVFTPYHKHWLREMASDPSLLDLAAEPTGNEKHARDDLKELFKHEIPKSPESKQFSGEEERERIRKLWPAGHTAGIKRLHAFLEGKIHSYAGHRSEPARDPSSRLSPYIAAGVISIREILTAARSSNDDAPFDDTGDANIAAWVRELVFREFYRHLTVVMPHTNMNLPNNLKFDAVQWEDDEAGWRKWCEGTTGVPFVDAGMRQLRAEAYMHNRLRMNTASYLRANLLIDYRKGERFFAQHLVDWDLSNNTQGWEPSYTVFNPVAQAEKCDKDGEYIRKWVPELKHVPGKAVFDPWNRLSRDEFDQLGYPPPHVDYKESSQRAKERYKRDLANADP